MGNEQNEGKELLLFQLGPVQEFIAQAETIGDLRAGSEMLSELAAAALKTVPDYRTESVFPAVHRDELDGIPNRFLVRVPAGKGKIIAEDAVKAAREHIKSVMSVKARERLPEALRGAFDRQVEAFLQTSWAVLKSPSGEMGRDYAAICKLMAMRRNARTFDAWPEEDTGKVKDFLSGKEAALDVKDSASANRNSGRGAMNLIKKERADRSSGAMKNPGKYIAVIAMDGDRMGAKLSGFKDAEEHRRFSEKLAAYARNVRIDPEDGVLIYAGGDDVLAVVKAERAIPIAEMLARDFTAALNDAGKKEITASAGVAVGSVKAPLQDVIREARAAEGRAKRVYGRDALAVSVLKRSGETLRWGCKWSSHALEIYRKLTANSERMSRFAYKLAGFLELYDLGKRGVNGELLVDWKEMKSVVRAETLHAVKQTQGMGKILDEADVDIYLSDEMVAKHPEDFLGLFLCETFINRPRN